MPLGIAPYTMYMNAVFGGERNRGRWTVAEVPGTENGNNFVSGAGTGCGIIEKSKNKKGCLGIFEMVGLGGYPGKIQQ